jgi:hypothetical protein
MQKWLVACLVAPVVICAALSGCTFSKVDANATIHISGRALDANGAPLANAAVRLFKEADLGEAVVGVVLAIGSLGTVCLLPNAPAVCRQAHLATTDANGNYQYALKGSDTQGLIGDEATLDLVVGTPGSNSAGASTTITFTVRKTAVALPDARLWNATSRITDAGAQVGISWSSLPAADGSNPSYSAQLFDPARQAALWSQPASGTRAQIDARVLEDHAADAAVAARTNLSGTGTGSVHGNYLSARTPVKASAGAPPSRHRSCAAVTGTVNPATVAQTACGVTDGNLVSPARLVSATAQVVTGVIVDLGRVRPINLVIARGLAGMFEVDLSTDGVSYHEVGIGTGSAVAVTPRGHPAARYVRVRAQSGLDESLMSEISVW